MSPPTRTRKPAGVRFDFSDHVVVITGASGGIGNGIVDLFAASGAKLVLHGRNVENLQVAADRVTAAGGSAIVTTGNVRLPESGEAIAEAAVTAYGRIDVLVNNAGGNFAARLEDLSPNAWNATIESNLSGAFHIARACLPGLRAAGGGSIVNIGSASASYAHVMRGAYAAAKAGLVSLTRTMAWEWAESGIRVNCVEPGPILTPAARFAHAETERKVSHYLALNRVGTPEDIAGVVAFLCSDAAAYITGETLTVTGGPHPSTPVDIDLIRTPLDSIAPESSSTTTQGNDHD